MPVRDEVLPGFVENSETPDIWVTNSTQQGVQNAQDESAEGSFQSMTEVMDTSEYFEQEGLSEVIHERLQVQVRQPQFYYGLLIKLGFALIYVAITKIFLNLLLWLGLCLVGMILVFKGSGLMDYMVALLHLWQAKCELRSLGYQVF